MADIKKMFEVCNFVIKNNAKIADVCDEFEMSRRTAQKYTGEYLKNYIAETGDELAKEMLTKLEEIKNNNEKESQIQKTDVDLEEVINYIISAKTSIALASMTFGISESTIHKYIQQLETTNKELYDRLREVQKIVSKEGHIKGGKTGIRGPKYNDFESTEMAQTMIEEDFTVTDASIHFDVPRSSLYERVKAVDYSEIKENLDEMLDSRKKKK